MNGSQMYPYKKSGSTDCKRGGGVVNPYSQPNREISAFFMTCLSQTYIIYMVTQKIKHSDFLLKSALTFPHVFQNQNFEPFPSIWAQYRYPFRI